MPAGPPIVRVLPERRALERAIESAARTGTPFDLVHTAHLPVPPGLSLPYTLTQHDLRKLELEGAPFARRLIAQGVIGRGVRGAAGVIVVSETMREALLTRFELDPARVHVVPNAADHFSPLPRPNSAERDGRGPILALGHVEPRKNLELLLGALAIDPELPDLRVAGRPKGDEGDRLRAGARALGIEQRVHFTGPFAEEELPELLASAACVAVPSRIEGFGIVALEAQRAGVPLAVSATSALVEVAGEGVPTFAPDDPRGCAQALQQALAQPTDVLAQHAERADRYRWDASADRWFDALCAAAQATGSTRR